jgi:hypothetical protein
MKPLNLDNRPCSPISSNCVIWQGPDIPCIKLCAGDTVSDVIASLGQELCTIMDQLNISNYDLECIGIAGCPPSDIKTLIELLISKVCDLNNTPQTDTKSTGTCPDCVVSVAPCFVQGNQTTMQLVDYVQMIANRVCSILDQISVINNQITNIDNRVTVLENTPPPVFTLPSFVVNCTLSPGVVIGGNSYPIDTILNALVNNSTNGYCALLGSTGFPADISSAVQGACITSSTPTVSQKPTPFGTVYNGSWVNTPITVADTITNLWITICDIYDYVSNFAINVQNTNSVNLNYTGGTLSANIQDTGWVDLLGFDFYSGNSITAYKPKCRRIGNVVHFRGMLMIPLSSNGTGGGSALPWEYGAIDTYVSNTTVAPFTGNGGVTFDNNGSLTFNSNGTTSLPVIPLTVMNAGTTFDSIVQSNYVVASRFIKLPSNDSAMLTTVVRIWIKSDKTLVLQYLKDNEYSAGGKAANITGTSVLNTLVSRVNLGDRLPQFARAGSEIAGNTTAGQQPLTATYYAGSPASETYPFTCNAGDPNNTGGFGWLSIDGMMAYINPCTTDIKNYNCP